MEPNKDNNNGGTPPTPPAGGTPPAAPAGGTPPNGGTPPTPPAGGTPPAAPEDYEKVKKSAEEYGVYRGQVDPILETLWADPELLKQVTESHNRRLGKLPPKEKPAGGEGTPPTSPAGGDQDTRNSQINIISERFEDKAGISKLDEKTKASARGMVGQMLKEMLDPKGNKTIQQVFDEVSLTKLPWYLDQAWKLVNRDNDIKAAEEKGKTSVLSQYEGEVGNIGSMGGGSIPLDDVVLTPDEKKSAARMGISEDDYLKNKKDILKLRNS